MLCKLTTLSGMPLTLPYRQVLSRLGFREQTSVPASQMELLKHNMQRAFAVVSAKGAYVWQKIIGNNGQSVVLADHSRIDCPAVASMLKNSQEVWLAAVTVGQEISDLTASCFNEGDAAAAAVCDAVGSECADAAMDFLQKYAATQMKRDNRSVSDCRFSPGYGDWTLDAQKDFFKWLDLQKLGMSLTSGLALIPEKSVTALAGIKINP
jgi:cobalamin-dependent methionine synthase I